MKKKFRHVSHIDTYTTPLESEGGSATPFDKDRWIVEVNFNHHGGASRVLLTRKHARRLAVELLECAEKECPL